MAEEDEAPEPWDRGRPLRKMLFGLVMLAVGVPFLVRAPAAWADRADYLAGRRCTDARVDDCLRETGATVDWVARRHVRRGRDGKDVWLRFDDPALARRGAGEQVGIEGTGAVADWIGRGRRVGVLLWDGEVARIDVAGVGRTETSDSPEDEVFGTHLGLMASAWGGYALWSGVDLWRRSRRWVALVPVPDRRLREPTRWAGLGRVLLAAVVGSMAGSVAGWLTGLSSIGQLVLTAVVVVLAWLVLATRRDRPLPVRVPRS